MGAQPVCSALSWHVFNLIKASTGPRWLGVL